MATYQDLRRYFDESEILQPVAQQALRVSILTGITLDVDPLWQRLYDAHDGAQEDNLLYRLRYLPEFFEFGSAFWDSNWDNMSDHALTASVFRGYRRRDLTKKIGRWEDFAERWKEYTEESRNPVRMTLVHRPLRSPMVDAESIYEEDMNDLLRLREIAMEVRDRATIKIEERPEANFSLSVGAGIRGAGATAHSGTLGGVLTEGRTSTLLGVTCAHLAKTGDKVDDADGNPMGPCIEHTALIPLPTGASQDPATYALPSPYPGNGPHVNMLDCALLKLSSTPNGLPVGGIASQLSIGQAVRMNGAQTSNEFTLGALAISYSFQSDGQVYCFRDSIELIPRPRLPIGGRLGHLMGVCPTQGDSGAWILTADSSRLWAGMLFGEDTYRGFLIRASWVHEWAKRVRGTNLDV